MDSRRSEGCNCGASEHERHAGDCPSRRPFLAWARQRREHAIQRRAQELLEHRIAPGGTVPPSDELLRDVLAQARREVGGDA